MKVALPPVLAIAVLVGCSQAPPPAATKKDEAKPAATAVDPATAGKISGKANFTGKKPAPKPIAMESEEECKKAHPGPAFTQDAVIASDGSLANVFVYIKSGLEGKSFAPASAAVRFDQKGCMFVPHVVGVQIGQTMSVSNSDSVSHNVHPMPRDNREWNQGQAPGAAPLERDFAKPELMIPVKCNVHAWMRGYVNVVPHPYFAVTGEDGAFEIKNVPPGEYVVEARHERFGTQETKITIGPSGTATAAFTFKGE